MVVTLYPSIKAGLTLILYTAINEHKKCISSHRREAEYAILHTDEQMHTNQWKNSYMCTLSAYVQFSLHKLSS